MNRHSTPFAFIIACAFACFASCATCADTITLKPSIRLAALDDVLTLSEIATLAGEEAARFADLVVLQVKPSSAAIEIPVRDVRMRLDEAGVNWGKVNLNGRCVVVRPARDSNAAAPLAMTPVSLTPDCETANAKNSSHESDGSLASELLDLPNLRGMVANLIVANLRVPADHVRLEFVAADTALLDADTRSARFEVQPLSSFASDRIDFTIRQWDGARVRNTQTISVKPLLLKAVVSLRRDVGSNQTILEDDLEMVEQWIAPAQAAMAINRVEAVGRMVCRSLQAGDVLREKHLRRDTLISRGDTVVVRCIVGGVAVSLQAEAKSEGAEGDTIELKKSGERETFRATVTARGEAVVDLTRR